jgi:hypothetical protein
MYVLSLILNEFNPASSTKINHCYTTVPHFYKPNIQLPSKNERTDIIASCPHCNIMCSEFPDPFREQKKSCSQTSNESFAIATSHATISHCLACAQHETSC